MSTKEAKEVAVDETVVKPASEKKLPKALSPGAEAIRQAIAKDGIEGDATNGVIRETKTNYVDLMPEGVTPETDKIHSDYRADFAAGTLAGMADATADMMAKSKKLMTVTGEFAMGSDSVHHAIHRSRESTFVVNGKPTTTVKIGATRTDVDIRGGRSSSGQLKIARNIVSEIISERLANKK